LSRRGLHTRCLSSRSEPDWDLARKDKKAALQSWFDELHARRATAAAAVTEAEKRRFQGLVQQKFMQTRGQQRQSLNRIGMCMAALVGEFVAGLAW